MNKLTKQWRRQRKLKLSFTSLPYPIAQALDLVRTQSLRGFVAERACQEEDRAPFVAKGRTPEEKTEEGEAREKERPTIQQPLTHQTSRLGKAARLPFFFKAWCKVTKNNFILRIVRDGYKIQFSSTPVQNSYTPRNYSSFSFPITEAKVKELLFEGALLIVKLLCVRQVKILNS